MKKGMVKTIAVAGMLAAMGSAHAGDGDLGIGVGVRYSTLGAGIEIGKSFTDNFSVRLGLNNFSESTDDTIDGIDYDAEMDFSSTALILDWHPFGGSFHVSAGYLDSNNELSVAATETGSVTIGDSTSSVTASGTFTLNGLVELGSGPYLGLGWGNVPAKGFGIVFEVGVVDMGAPDISLTCNYAGTDPNNPLSTTSGNCTEVSGLGITQADIDQEVANMQGDLDEFDTYPVIALGISYGF